MVRLTSVLLVSHRRSVLIRSLAILRASHCGDLCKDLQVFQQSSDLNLSFSFHLDRILAIKRHNAFDNELSATESGAQFAISLDNLIKTKIVEKGEMR